MSDNANFHIKLTLEVQHLITGETFWASTQKFFTTHVFKISKEEKILQTYLRIFHTFPTFMSHNDCSIYHASTLYWGKNDLNGIEGYLLKIPTDDWRTLPPATPTSSGTFKIAYLLLLVPSDTQISPNLIPLLNSISLQNHGSNHSQT